MPPKQVQYPPVITEEDEEEDSDGVSSEQREPRSMSRRASERLRIDLSMHAESQQTATGEEPRFSRSVSWRPFVLDEVAAHTLRHRVSGSRLAEKDPILFEAGTRLTSFLITAASCVPADDVTLPRVFDKMARATLASDAASKTSADRARGSQSSHMASSEVSSGDTSRVMDSLYPGLSFMDGSFVPQSKYQYVEVRTRLGQRFSRPSSGRASEQHARRASLAESPTSC